VFKIFGFPTTDFGHDGGGGCLYIFSPLPRRERVRVRVDNKGEKKTPPYNPQKTKVENIKT